MATSPYLVPGTFTREAAELRLEAANIELDNVLKRYRRVMKHPTVNEIAAVRHDIISAAAVILHWRSVLLHWEELSDAE